MNDEGTQTNNPDGPDEWDRFEQLVTGVRSAHRLAHQPALSNVPVGQPDPSDPPEFWMHDGGLVLAVARTNQQYLWSDTILVVDE